MNIGGIGQYNNQINQTENNADKILGKIAAMHEYSSLDGSTQMIMDNMRSEFNTISQGIQNSNEFSGLLNIADSSLQNMSKSADQLQALSVRYNNDALNSSQKASLRTEADGIMRSMSDTVRSSTYNDQSVFRSDMKVFDGQSTITANVARPNLSGLSIEDPDSIESFQTNIHNTLSSISGTQNQLDSSRNKNYKALTSYSDAYNSGFDLAENVAEFEKEKLLNEAAHFANSMNTEYIKKQALSLLQM
jgi:flagellin